MNIILYGKKSEVCQLLITAFFFNVNSTKGKILWTNGKCVCMGEEKIDLHLQFKYSTFRMSIEYQLVLVTPIGLVISS